MKRTAVNSRWALTSDRKKQNSLPWTLGPPAMAIIRWAAWSVSVVAAAARASAPAVSVVVIVSRRSARRTPFLWLHLVWCWGNRQTEGWWEISLHRLWCSDVGLSKFRVLLYTEYLSVCHSVFALNNQYKLKLRAQCHAGLLTGVKVEHTPAIMKS